MLKFGFLCRKIHVNKTIPFGCLCVCVCVCIYIYICIYIYVFFFEKKYSFKIRKNSDAAWGYNVDISIPCFQAPNLSIVMFVYNISI